MYRHLIVSLLLSAVLWIICVCTEIPNEKKRLLENVKRYQSEIREISLNPSLAWMSSVYDAESTADRAVRSSCAAEGWDLASSTKTEMNPGFAIDLDGFYKVEKIVVTPRKVKFYRFKVVHAFVAGSKPLLDKSTDFTMSCAYFEGPATSEEKVNFNCNDTIGRYAAIILQSFWEYLEMCHISIHGVRLNGTKIPLSSKKAWMTSTYSNLHADKAVKSSCKAKNIDVMSSTEKQLYPGWAIDLKAFYYVENVTATVANSKDTAKEFKEAFVFVTDYEPRLRYNVIAFPTSCAYFQGPPTTAGQEVDFKCNTIGRFAAIVLKLNDTKLELCHVSINGWKMVSRQITLEPSMAWMSSTLDKDSRAHGAVSLPNLCDKRKWMSSTTKEKVNPAWAIDLQRFYFVLDVDVKTVNEKDLLSVLVASYKPFFPRNLRKYFSKICDDKQGNANIVFRCYFVGRFVAIVLGSGILKICQVSVYGVRSDKTELNLYHNSAWMTSEVAGKTAGMCISNECSNSDEFMTSSKKEDFPAWAIDLWAEYLVSSIVITSPNNIGPKFENAFAFVFTGQPNVKSLDFKTSCDSFKDLGGQRKTIIFGCFKVGRFAYLALNSKSVTLEICHVAIYRNEITDKIVLDAKLAWLSSADTSSKADKCIWNKCTNKETSMLSTKYQMNPAWGVDLKRKYLVRTVVVTTPNIGSTIQFGGMNAFVSIKRPNLDHINFSSSCASFEGDKPPPARHSNVEFNCNNTVGRYVHLSKKSKKTSFQLCHVAIYKAGDPQKLLLLNVELAWMTSILDDNKLKSGADLCIWNDQYMSSTKKERAPAWAVDLVRKYFVSSLAVTAGENQFKDVFAYVSDKRPNLSQIDDNETCAEFVGRLANPKTVVHFHCYKYGQFAYLARKFGPAYLQICHVEIYVLTGKWSLWTSWSSCSKTCGIGHYGRTRKCDNPAVRYGSTDCEGYGIENKMCNLGDCPPEVKLTLTNINKDYFEAGMNVTCETNDRDKLRLIVMRQICDQKTIFSSKCYEDTHGDSCVLKIKGFEEYHFCSIQCEGKLYPEVTIPLKEDRKDICILPSFSKWTECQGKCGIGKQLRKRICVFEYGQSVKNDRPCHEYDNRDCDTGIKCLRPKVDPPLTKRAGKIIERSVKYIWDLSEYDDPIYNAP